MDFQKIDLSSNFYNENPRHVAGDINQLVSLCYGRSFNAGWHVDITTGKIVPVDVPLKLCLIHSEISEAMEGYRKNLNDDKLPERLMIEVELADALIRIMDLSGAIGLDLGGAVKDKLAYNASRPDHKIENRQGDNGKKF